MSPGSSTDSYPAFAHIGLRENSGKNFKQCIPNLSAEHSDGITVFRISTMTSLMLHRVTPPSTITTCTAGMIVIEPSSSFVPIPLQHDVIDVHRSADAVFTVHNLYGPTIKNPRVAFVALLELWYLSPIVHSSPIVYLVPFPFLKPNCSSSNCSSILEYKRRFSIRKRIFAECDIRLIVLNSLHYLALFFFGIGINTVSIKSSEPRRHIVNSTELVSIVRFRNMFAFSSDERAFNIESYFRTEVKIEFTVRKALFYKYHRTPVVEGGSKLCFRFSKGLIIQHIADGYHLYYERRGSISIEQGLYSPTFTYIRVWKKRALSLGNAAALPGGFA
ncbi:hypothetical protein ANN_15936 [Periplaneta americana]|uniref:Uncharacterized protein n=1 Tax=Periplaneta americana TaxID=6978 RepID=A0ABQ8SIV4_PERAM|nr:hypothetical protein ANN_15936 [Periplaneta americana]